jgi:hypothetical protein
MLGWKKERVSQPFVAASGTFTVFIFLLIFFQHSFFRYETLSTLAPHTIFVTVKTMRVRLEHRKSPMRDITTI